ncbi:hypothetical protein LOD99_11732 [Oopsacas minuta]|uniref:Exoribonuclease phosphorolytic domain-containing protein n=1 Tax=Oopsacas minuta TaxID=111878 RepID=A0AAV7JKC1_9METZ|nr:hypothetical protein LOD99_11732 [Oopsacas minuta]
MHTFYTTIPEQTHSWRTFDTNSASKNVSTPVRGDNDFRPVFFQLSAVSNARGSSYLEWGGNKILCSVFGPRENTLRRDEFSIKGRLVCEVSICPFSIPHTPNARQQSYIDTDRLSALLVSSLESSVCIDKYPKSQIEICLLFIETDTLSMSTAAVLSASLALIDARIEVWDITIACSCMIRSENSVKMDPSWSEITDSEYVGLLTLFYQPSLNVVSGVECEGELTNLQLVKGMDSCIEGCLQLKKYIEGKLKENILKSRAEK